MAPSTPPWSHAPKGTDREIADFLFEYGIPLRWVSWHTEEGKWHKVIGDRVTVEELLILPPAVIALCAEPVFDEFTEEQWTAWLIRTNWKDDD